MTTLVPTLTQLSPDIEGAVLSTVWTKRSAAGIADDVLLWKMRDRIIDLVTSIDNAGTLAHDADWYGRAHELASGWAGAFNLPLRTVAGVIAVTSPQTSWTRNRVDAYTILTIEREYHDVPTPVLADRILSAQRADGSSLTTQPRRVLEAALDMIRTMNPRAYLGNGPKVRSFYSNIIDPLGSTDVTVDTHMLRAMLGDPDMPSSGPEYKATLGSRAPQRKADGYTDGLYPYFAQAIKDASRMLGLTPSQAQAAAWCQWRRAQGAWGGTVDSDPVYPAASTLVAVLGR